ILYLQRHRRHLHVHPPRYSLDNRELHDVDQERGAAAAVIEFQQKYSKGGIVIANAYCFPSRYTGAMAARQSGADITRHLANVRFAPESGHKTTIQDVRSVPILLQKSPTRMARIGKAVSERGTVHTYSRLLRSEWRRGRSAIRNRALDKHPVVLATLTQRWGLA